MHLKDFPELIFRKRMKSQFLISGRWGLVWEHPGDSIWIRWQKLITAAPPPVGCPVPEDSSGPSGIGVNWEEVLPLTITAEENAGIFYNRMQH